MIDPVGADDSPHGALSSDERAALAAWADDSDVSDGFTDDVVAAWLAEQVTVDALAGDGLGEHDDPGGSVGAEPRPTVRSGRAKRVVGWVAALSAAAVVMLMVRVLPRASEVGDAGTLACHAERTEGSSSPATAEPPRSSPGASTPELTLLADQAATVLAHHCSPCHDSTDPGAKAGALEVFDLDQRYWWPTMSDAQLDDARTRVRERESATDDERRRVDAFVDAELRRRARAG